MRMVIRKLEGMGLRCVSRPHERKIYNSTKQGTSSDTDGRSVGQEILCLL